MCTREWILPLLIFDSMHLKLNTLELVSIWSANQTQFGIPITSWYLVVALLTFSGLEVLEGHT